MIHRNFRWIPLGAARHGKMKLHGHPPVSPQTPMCQENVEELTNVLQILLRSPSQAWTPASWPWLCNALLWGGALFDFFRKFLARFLLHVWQYSSPCGNEKKMFAYTGTVPWYPCPYGGERSQRTCKRPILCHEPSQDTAVVMVRYRSSVGCLPTFTMQLSRGGILHGSQHTASSQDVHVACWVFQLFAAIQGGNRKHVAIQLLGCAAGVISGMEHDGTIVRNLLRSVITPTITITIVSWQLYWLGVHIQVKITAFLKTKQTYGNMMTSLWRPVDLGFICHDFLSGLKPLKDMGRVASTCQRSLFLMVDPQ